MPTFTTKLLALGLTTALGGAGAFFGGSAAASPIERPLPPTSFTAGQAPSAELSAELERFDPVVLADPRVAAALRDPMVRAMLADPAVRQATADIDPAVLGRPGVIEAIQSGSFDPALATDSLVLANLPAILSAVPVIRAAAQRLEMTDGDAPERQTTAAEGSASEEDLDEERPGAQRSENARRGRSAAAHAARDARREANEARRAARREILRNGRSQPGDAPRGVTADQRAELRAIGADARTARGANGQS